jgi:hypothetical protein
MSKVVPYSRCVFLSISLTIITVYGGFNFAVNMTPINYLGDPTRTSITGQFDPRGDDGQGSPIGGLVFSNAFASGNGSLYQAVEWDR